MFRAETFDEIAKFNGDVYDYHQSAQTLEAIVEASIDASIMVHDIMVQKDCISFKVDGIFTGIFVWCDDNARWLEFESGCEFCGAIGNFATIERAAENLVRNFEQPY